MRRTPAALVSIAVSVAATGAAASTLTSATSANPTCLGKHATIIGLGSHRTVYGSGTDDVIIAPGSNVHVLAGPGNDRICVGPNAVVDGGGGNDRVQFSSGTIHGNAGDDVLTQVRAGNATAWGDAGNDTITLVGGTVTAHGGAGNDRITGATKGTDVSLGEAGNDTLVARGAKTTLSGGAGADTFTVPAKLAKLTRLVTDALDFVNGAPTTKPVPTPAPTPTHTPSPTPGPSPSSSLPPSASASASPSASPSTSASASPSTSASASPSASATPSTSPSPSESPSPSATPSTSPSPSESPSPSPSSSPSPSAVPVPTLSFTITPTGVSSPWVFGEYQLDTELALAAGDAVKSWTIDFGDGTSSQSGVDALPDHLMHTYSVTSGVSSTLTVVDTAANTVHATAAVPLEPAAPEPPTAHLAAAIPFATTAPVSVSTVGTAPASGSTLASWTLAWGDDGGADSGTGAPPATLTHSYAVGGAYAATLTLLDADGAFASSSATLTQQDTTTHAHVRVFREPSFPPVSGEQRVRASTAVVGRTMELDATQTVGPLPGTPGYPPSPFLIVTIDPGDGTGAHTGTDYGHAYANAGTYLVTVTATAYNDLGQPGSTDTAHAFVMISADDAAASLGPDQQVSAGTTVHVPLTGTHAATGANLSGAVIRWGDGSADAPDPHALPAELTHTYADPREYTATLIITDDRGSQRTTSVKIAVVGGAVAGSITGRGDLTDGTDSVADTQWIATEVAGPSTGLTTTAATIDGTFVPAAGHTLTTWSVDWADGHVDTGTFTPDAAGAGSIEPSHAYTSAGERTVTVTVSDDQGSVAKTLHVSTAPTPVLTLTVDPANPSPGQSYTVTPAGDLGGAVLTGYSFGFFNGLGGTGTSSTGPFPTSPLNGVAGSSGDTVNYYLNVWTDHGSASITVPVTAS